MKIELKVTGRKVTIVNKERYWALLNDDALANNLEPMLIRIMGF